MSSRPRIRSIKPELWQDERVGDLSRDARLLFIGLITMADDEGRFRALPSLILGHVFPYDVDAPRRLHGWLREVADAGLIVLYEVDGRPYGELPGFRRHQRINRPSPSRLPPPPLTEDSVNDHGTGGETPRTDEPEITERSSPRARARSGADRIGSDQERNPPLTPPRAGGSRRRRHIARARQQHDQAVADWLDRHPCTPALAAQWRQLSAPLHDSLDDMGRHYVAIVHPHRLAEGPDGTVVLGVPPGSLELAGIIEQSRAAQLISRAAGGARVRVLPCGCPADDQDDEAVAA